MKQLLAILEPIIKLLQPPRFSSWQTLILVSIFLWLVAFFVRNPWQTRLIGLGWILLIVGLLWLTAEKPLWFYGFSLTSWLVGALICVAIFGRQSAQIPPIAMVLWPTISGAIAALTELVKAGPKVEIPPPTQRQKVVILMLSHILISCWFQFMFLTNNWLRDYPSILADNRSQGAFAINIDRQKDCTSRGITILNSMGTRLTAELDKKPWPTVEQWLLNASEKVTALGKQAMQKLPDRKEEALWNFAVNVTSREPGYNLQLLASWQGPSSYLSGYHLKKSCQILPTQRLPIAPSSSPSQSKTATTSVASPSALSQVKCGPVSQPISGQPKST